MLRISCPHCGPRNETEFRCGGESHVVRPLLNCSAESWADYLYFRHNPKGLTFERWNHTYGCGCWFNIARDTCTHEILATYGMLDPKPELDRERIPRLPAAGRAVE